MFPEPTELLLIGCSTESIWTQKSKSNTMTSKTDSRTYWSTEISHVMNGFCVCFTVAISVQPIVLKWCRKRTQKDSGEERVTAKSRPMMSLIARSSERAPSTLSSTASESPGKTRQESQTWKPRSRETSTRSTTWTRERARSVAVFVVLVLCCHTHLLHTSHGSRCSSVFSFHPIVIAMHAWGELSLWLPWPPHHLHLPPFIPHNLKQFLLPFNFSEAK